MDAYVRKSLEEQRLFCEQAQALLSLPAASVEKDLWVCWTMRVLFNLPEWGPRLTLKGGTSLSKAWKIIRRFSEDIDVVVDRDFLGYGGDDLSAKRQKKLMKTCSERLLQDLMPQMQRWLEDALPSDRKWSLTPASVDEDKDQQTLLLYYPASCEGTLGYVRPVVKLEFGARSDTEPSATASVQPYLTDALPQVLQASTFEVRTVAARRTFWEKAMLLHEETFRPPEKKRKARLSRHYYDLWCLIKAGTAQEAVADAGLFDRVARHRAQFFQISWVDYSTLKRGSLRLVPPREHLIYWQEDYRAMQESMFFETAPDLNVILETVGEFERTFNGGSAVP